MKNRRSLRPVLIGAALFVLGPSGCAPAPLNAAFTSRVLQREACRVLGDRPEVCTREEAATDIRVRLVERDDGLIWLHGVPRGSAGDRSLLGTRDDDGGFLFTDLIVQENDISSCALADRLEISIAIDPAADPALIGDNACVALLGRETRVTTSSAGCDLVNNPPLASQLIQRRRWEAPPTCTP
jgi:hypothetical protein